MFYLFKDGERITDGYALSGEIPVQTEWRTICGMMVQVLLWPRRLYVKGPQDGYEVREIDGAG